MSECSGIFNITCEGAPDHFNRSGLGVIAFDARTIRLVCHLYRASDAPQRLVETMKTWRGALCS